MPQRKLAKKCKGQNQDQSRCKKRTKSSTSFCELHRSQATLTTTTLPLRPRLEATPASANQSDISHDLLISLLSQHTDEPPTEKPLRNEPPPEEPLVGNISNLNQYTNKQSTGETSVDPHGSIWEEGNIINPTILATPAKNTITSPPHSTPFNAVSGSLISDNAELRRFPMAANLTNRSYISSTLLDTFIEDIPKVTQEHVDDLCKKDEWKTFIGSCTGGKKSNSSTYKSSSDSNKEEFKAVIQCIANLDGLGECFRKPEANNPRRGHVRISHQGNSLMKTWNTEARWLKGNYGSTTRLKELKPDLMTIVVEDAESQRPRKTQPKFVRLAKPTTILPPPNNWKPAPMDDKSFPIVECREPVWECLDVLWECKRNSQDLKNAKVYIDCALKAAEALRYQWSRRYVYCFLHCGSIMRLLHFDRSGLMASKPLDIEIDTAKFIQCLLGAFYHKPSRLGYPAGKEAPFHKYNPDNRLFQVVTVDGRQLYIDDQEAGPSRDHLISRATVAFKAKLVNPKEEEKTGWDWCYKSSWPQELRKHEGHYLSSLQDQPNIVELLAYGVVKVENENDTTVFGRQCSSRQPMTLLETFYDRAKAQRLNFTQHTGSATSASEDPMALLYDPRRPEGGLQQDCDNREHRDIVTAWVSSSFSDAVSLLDSLPTISSIWQQAFSAVKVMAKRGIVHRDISFTNIRIDNQHTLKVCDLDMAASTDNQGTGAQDRTGTVAFMATSLLSKSSAPSTHRPVHDCESIFWLCTIDLLSRVGIGDVKENLVTITSPGAGINLVRSTKREVVTQLSNFKRKTERLEAYASLNTRKDSLLFFCLTELMREFVNNDYVNDYEGAEDGTENVCFDRCIEIIKRALDSGVEQATEGIAKTSLSL